MIVIAFLTVSACRNSSRDSVKSADIPVIKPVIVRSFPHDTSAFTQGLLFHNGTLYESAGLYGKSSLRCVSISDGAVIKQINCDSAVFAEGLAMQAGRLVQLTWQEQTAILYSVSDFSFTGTFSYSGEGWGLTSYRDGFIMSNGTDTLVIRDQNFAITDRIPVRLKNRPLSSLNELEYANQRVYANVWYSNFIFEIDLQKGSVNRIIDCTDLLLRCGEMSGNNVLNGIAFDAGTGRFFITGKKWPLMFEVEIP
jgi:glutamine cyclotransferase